MNTPANTYEARVNTKNAILPTDAYLASLNVAQLVAILKSQMHQTTIEAAIITNRVVCLLTELKGEEFAEKVLDGVAVILS